MSEFKGFKKAVQAQFEAMIKDRAPLFVTGIEKDVIWDTYLDSFPVGTNPIYKEKREFDCNSCRRFLRPFGNIVSIQNNKLVSIWDIEELDYPFGVVAEELSRLVKSAPIKNIFVTKDNELGTDKSHMMEDGTLIAWEHFYLKLPVAYVTTSSKSAESVQGTARSFKEVFKRSMDELTIDAGNTILELIEQGSIYRGEEQKKAISTFISYKKKYDKIPVKSRDTWCWANATGNPIAKIRNTAIGQLLINISEDMDINVAVSKFEAIMAPANYKRPKEIYTKKMIEQAEAKIVEMGFADSLGRKEAALEDITINNVIWTNGNAKKKMSGSIFEELKESVPENVKKFDKLEEVAIEDFINNILPTATNVEVLMENAHRGNLMNLVAPSFKEAPSMLKWSNNFSWSYNGDVADSMKQNVKNAGGNVEGILRFSIQWNDGDNNQNDFDAHCKEPKGNLISYQSKSNRLTSGSLDVDIQHPRQSVAVENITWTDINKMQEGTYTFQVHNYSHNGGRTGFTAEIEYNGDVYSYVYDKELRQNAKVLVAQINFSKVNGIEFIESLDSTSSSKEVWGIKTNKFTKTSVVMFSPNYWDGQKGIGPKHYFFFLEGCENEATPRGFYNEQLNDSLLEHKRVFEAMGSKMRVESSEGALAGLGFSSTQRNSIVAKVEGSISRIIKINF